LNPSDNNIRDIISGIEMMREKKTNK
jgi:hypothetical protein